MDRTTLLNFINRIVRSPNSQQASMALEQLAEILKTHGETESCDLVKRTRESLGELSVTQKQIDERDIALAWERLLDRRRREAEARNYGRC